MKKLLFLLAIGIINTSYAQITTTQVTLPTEKFKQIAYDSIDNFVGKDVSKYIGQELYVKGLAKSLREYGYEGFTKNYVKDRGSRTSYSTLNGKYFKVLDVIKHPQASEDDYLYGSKYYLKLKEKGTDNILFYCYDSQFMHSFPFIVVGYFEKAKLRYIGTEYLLRGRNWVDSKDEMFDIKNGKSVDFSVGSLWKCVDLTIEEKYYTLSLIIENSKGDKLAYSMDNILKGNYFAFSKTDADKYEKEFGSENWNSILSGKVNIGMTKKMCELSWGEPTKINQTITEDKNTEQWVYKSNYLYFDHNTLTAIQ